MNGNIALSMEIGSAYALQVCLLQIPCLVLFSAIHGHYIDATQIINHTFSKWFLFLSFHFFTTRLHTFSADWICSPDIPAVGYGNGHSMRVPSLVYVWRGQKQLLQGIDPYSVVPSCSRGLLLLQL